MIKPNPANVFGRPQSRTPESPATYVYSGDEMTIPAAPETTTDDEASRAATVNHILGNHELPIALYREQIVDAVDRSQATIITAETGAGKSTQVPQFLAEQGYEVIVTQPRVVAARSVAQRVREEVVSEKGVEYEKFVGYRTARERGDSPENQIQFVTDGLQLVRELSGNGAGKKQALVLDEVHEWNENMEVLVAWSKQRMSEDSDFKVVVMSATMEATPLAQYLADDSKREVPVIEVPGRTYEVKKSEGGNVADQAIKMAREGKNTLVFVPGEGEIKAATKEITKARIPGATVLPLYGQLEAEEQKKVFANYPGAKIIVATNVAQTSITIDDIDAVVDSGLERRKEVRNGVEGLYLRPVSQADCLQRAGRAGRTKEGEYVLAQLGNNPLVPLADREAYGTPEILRTRLDGMVLRLAKNGLDASKMDFFHNKDDKGRDIGPEIVAAKERLQKLGTLREDDSVTKIGRDMERMPVESHYARMMIEARQYGPNVQMQMAAILAVQEAGSVAVHARQDEGTVQKVVDSWGFEREEFVPKVEGWRKYIGPENDSDMIKQLEVYIAARGMKRQEMRDCDIHVKTFGRVNEVLNQLRKVENLRGVDLSTPTAEQREQLIRCIISGMTDNFYIGTQNDYENPRGEIRNVSNKSLIRPSYMVVGSPFNLQINLKRGLRTLYLLESPTNVPSIDVLREIAPQLLTERTQGLVVGQDGVVQERFSQIFNGMDIHKEVLRPAEPSKERRELLIREAMRTLWYSDTVQNINNVMQDLSSRQPNSAKEINYEDLQVRLAEVVTDQVDSVGQAIELAPPITIGDFISPEERDAIYASSPDEIDGISLNYRSGKPVIAQSMSEDEMLLLQADKLVLPDGRAVHVAIDAYGNVIPITDRQETVQRERAERVEYEKAQHEILVGRAIEDYIRGRDKEQIVRTYGELACEVAEARYKTVKSERLEAERQEQIRQQAEQQAARERLTALVAKAEKMQGSAQGCHVMDAPDDIYDEAEDIRIALQELIYELESDMRRVEWGHEVAFATYDTKLSQTEQRLDPWRKKYDAWLSERDTPGVSESSLEELRSKFNNYR